MKTLYITPSVHKCLSPLVHFYNKERQIFADGGSMKLERKSSHICSHSLLNLDDLGNIIKVKGNSKCAPSSTEYEESKRDTRSLSCCSANW
jgi:hypothetical protein